MEIENGNNGKIIKGCDGFRCVYCNSIMTKTIQIKTHDSDWSHNSYLNKCEDCKNTFWIHDR